MAKRFLSLDEVVAEAMTVVPGATSEDELIARQWAYNALRQFGPSNDYIDVATLYPENLTLRKPDDLYKPLDIALFDGTGLELRNKYRAGGQRIHSRNNNLGELTSASDSYDLSVEVSEDDYFFYLSSNGIAVAYAKLRYFRLPVDEHGIPQFPESTRLPVLLFIRYMWALRTGARDVSFHEQSWKVARNEARGANKVPNGLAYKQFAKEWISMMPNNKFDRF
jgi:hypothetical protein